jgi:hypothetical protein
MFIVSGSRKKHLVFIGDTHFSTILSLIITRLYKDMGKVAALI